MIKSKKTSLRTGKSFRGIQQKEMLATGISVAGFKAQFRRKFVEGPVVVTRWALEVGFVSSAIDRKRAGDHLENTNAETFQRAARAGEDAEAEGGGISICVVSHGHRMREFGETVGNVSNSTRKLAVIVIFLGGRVLNVRHGQTAADDEGEGTDE